MNGGRRRTCAECGRGSECAQLLELFAASLLFSSFVRGRGHARAQSGCGTMTNTFIGAISIVQGLAGWVQWSGALPALSGGLSFDAASRLEQSGEKCFPRANISPSGWKPCLIPQRYGTSGTLHPIEPKAGSLGTPVVPFPNVLEAEFFCKLRGHPIRKGHSRMVSAVPLFLLTGYCFGWADFAAGSLVAGIPVRFCCWRGPRKTLLPSYSSQNNCPPLA